MMRAVTRKVELSSSSAAPRQSSICGRLHAEKWKCLGYEYGTNSLYGPMNHTSAGHLDYRLNRRTPNEKSRANRRHPGTSRGGTWSQHPRKVVGRCAFGPHHRYVCCLVRVRARCALRLPPALSPTWGRNPHRMCARTPVSGRFFPPRLGPPRPHGAATCPPALLSAPHSLFPVVLEAPCLRWTPSWRRRAPVAGAPRTPPTRSRPRPPRPLPLPPQSPPHPPVMTWSLTWTPATTRGG